MQALLKYLLTGNFRATAGSTKNKSLVKTASDKSKLVQRESRNYSVCIPLQKWQHPLNILHNMSPIEQEFWTDCVEWNNEETFLACCQHSSRVGDVSLLGHKLFSSYWTFFCNTFTNIRAHRSDSAHLVAPQGYSSVQF